MGSDLAEKAEILPENQKGAVQNGMDVAARSEVPAVADGGAKAYIVALASFLVNGLLFGIINSYSVIYTVLLNRLTQKGIEGAEVKASLAGSLTIGTTFALSPVSGILTEFLGLRKTAVLGGIIATVSMLISSFTVDHIEAFCFTYGIMFGLGASFAYTPSLAILGHYFKRKLGIVNGVVTVGSCVFTVFITTFMEDIINNYGIEWMLRSLSLFTLGVVFCGLLFVPVTILAIEKPKCKDFKSVLKVIVNKPMWRIPRYRIWALSLPIALFGYFVPYVHIKKFIQDKFPGDINVNLPLQCIAVTSALGRISFGLLADRKGVNRIMLQQVSFYFIGMLTIILPFINMFALVVVISLGMGLFDGGFIALIGPIAFELVGTAHAAQAIGCMLGLAAIPLSIGPSIAGAIHSIYKNYTLPFVLAGISPLIGATVMFLVHWAKNTQAPQSNTNGRAITLNDRDIEKIPAPLLTANGQANQQATH